METVGGGCGGVVCGSSDDSVEVLAEAEGELLES